MFSHKVFRATLWSILVVYTVPQGPCRICELEGLGLGFRERIEGSLELFISLNTTILVLTI